MTSDSSSLGKTRAQAARSGSDNSALSARTLYLLVFLGFSLLYLLTAQRGVSWQDSGLFQSRVLLGDYTGSWGIAVAHPVYIALGDLLAQISRRHLPFLLNGLSGVAMAFALANLSLIATALTKNRWVALLVPTCLGLTHCIWWMSTIAEVYTLYLSVFTLELYFAIRFVQDKNPRHLLFVAALNGFSFGIHNFALLVLPVYALVFAPILRAQAKGLRLFSLAAASWLLASTPVWILCVLEYGNTGDLGATIVSLLFGRHMDQVTNLTQLNPNFVANMAFTALSISTPLVLFAVSGFWRLVVGKNRPLAFLVIGVVLVEAVFFLRYNVPDQFTFFLPTMTAVSVLATLGLDHLLKKSSAVRTASLCSIGAFVMLSVPAYSLLPSLARKAKPSLTQVRQPGRDEARYWLVPWKHNESSAHDMALACLGENGAGPELELPTTTIKTPFLAWQQVHPGSQVTKLSYSGEREQEIWTSMPVWRRVQGKELFKLMEKIGCPLGGELAR